MNGVKGGIRDWIIALFFSKKKQKKKEKEEINPSPNKNNTKKIISGAPKTFEDENKSTTIEDKNKYINKTQQETPKKNNQVPYPTLKNTKTQIISNAQKEKVSSPIEDSTKKEKINSPLTEEITGLDETLQNDKYIEFLLVGTIMQIIKDDLSELERIKFELEVLSQKEEDEVLTEEVEKLKRELEELLKIFEKIKDKYYYTQQNNELEKIDDKYLNSLLEEYKEQIKNTDLLNNLENHIDTINEYISFIDQLIVVEKETDQLDEKIDEKLDKFEIRDEEFEQMKEDYQDIEGIYSLIDDFNAKQDSILKELEYKVKKSEEINKRIETTIEYIPHINRLITAALLIAASKKIPPTLGGNLLKINMFALAIHSIANVVTTKESKKTITTIKYTDYSKTILGAKENISSAISKIDYAFGEIDIIRENFKKECGDYQYKIPEYDELMTNLDNIENQLKEKQRLIKKQHEKVNQILVQNNEKVKRLEKMENSTGSIAS